MAVGQRGHEEDAQSTRIKIPTRRGESIDLGRELNGYTDWDGNPANREQGERGKWG